MNPKSNNFVGEIVSRITMAIVGSAMLLGGCKCLSIAHRILDESVGDGRGFGIFALIGIVLVILGGFFVLAAFVRVSVLARWVQSGAAGSFDGNEASDTRVNLLRFFTWW